MEEKIHSLLLEERTTLKISCCDEVTEFNDREIALFAKDSSLVIKGSNLKVEEVSKQSGEVVIKGDCIDSIVYANKGRRQKEGIVRRLLK